MADTHHPADDESRALARTLLESAQFAALGTLWEGAPMVSRVGCLWLPGRGLGLLLSDLADHARALAQDARCSVLIGEPGDRGDPLTHPRLTLMGRANVVEKGPHRDDWLTARPKAKLYYDFADFRLRVVDPTCGMLNGGFGKATRLTAGELAP